MDLFRKLARGLTSPKADVELLLESTKVFRGTMLRCRLIIRARERNN